MFSISSDRVLVTHTSWAILCQLRDHWNEKRELLANTPRCSESEALNLAIINTYQRMIHHPEINCIEVERGKKIHGEGIFPLTLPALIYLGEIARKKEISIQEAISFAIADEYDHHQEKFDPDITFFLLREIGANYRGELTPDMTLI
jgi:hypothetical protein